MSVGLLDAPTMAKKRGRPESGRNDVSVRIDAEVVRLGRIVAQAERISLAEYFSGLIAPQVKRDALKLGAKLLKPDPK